MKKRLSIAFIIDIYPTYSTFILNQVEGLISMGHDVFIFPKYEQNLKEFHIINSTIESRVIFPITTPINRWLKYYKCIIYTLKQFYKMPNILFSVFNYNKFGRRTSNLNIFYEVLPFTIRNWDIIQVHFADNVERALTLRKAGFNFKLFLMFHGYDLRECIKNPSINYLNFAKQADFVQSICNYNTNILLKSVIDRMKLVSHNVGIDIKKIRIKSFKTKSNRKVIILSVGRLVWEKGYYDAIYVVEHLVKSGYDIHYHIIGGGYEEDELRELVKKKKLESFIEFHGPASQNKINSFMLDSDIFFLPSIQEATPLVLMEALYVGLKIVATNVGGVAEILNNKIYGTLVESKNRNQMHYALIKIIKEIYSGDCINNFGREHIVKNYDINKLNKKLEFQYYTF